MMLTAKKPSSPLLWPAIALCCVLSLPACRTVSTLPSSAQTNELIQKTSKPKVACKKPRSGYVPLPPREDEWVDPKLATLSEKAADWIIEVLALFRTERALREEEHRCLDWLEKKGLIEQ